MQAQARGMGGRLYLFTPEALAEVPEATGAYFLFRGEDPVYAGIAAGGATLRSELTAQLHCRRGAAQATHFTWQAAGDALEAYRLQLAAYARWGAWTRPE